MEDNTVVIAVDKFKGSLSAAQVAQALARGIGEVVPAAMIVEVPVADGGDGSLDLMLESGYEARCVPITSPAGSGQHVTIGVKDTAAFIELASICGIGLLSGRPVQPDRATSYLLGSAITATLDLGVDKITMGLGGSASNDGGLGMLVALGAGIFDRDGRPVRPDTTGMMRAHELDLSTLDPRLYDAEVVAAADVRSPLSGPYGATVVFGPQKGFAASDISALDAAMTRWGNLLHRASGRPTDVPGAGAAGGIGAAVVSALRGVIVPGATNLLDAIGFDAALDSATLVITGEGRWDQQTRAGKAPFEVLRRAQARFIPAIVVAGRVDEAPRCPAVVATYSLMDLEPDLDIAMRDAELLLTRTGREIGRSMATTHALAPFTRGRP